jgi:UDPglucose 6-dehydrogenase
LQSGRCNLSLVLRAVSDLPRGVLPVVRSTVPPGEITARHVMWPETLASESAYPTPHGFDRDVSESPHFILGGAPADTAEVVGLLLPCGGPHKRYVQTSAELACLGKYLVNAFGAMKVAFCYEMAEACRAAGLDWHAARELLLLDPRIGPDWTAVFPGNKEPYSGKCLPKDIAALAAWCGQAGHDAGLLRAVIEANGRLGRLRGER